MTTRCERLAPSSRRRSLTSSNSAASSSGPTRTRCSDRRQRVERADLDARRPGSGDVERARRGVGQVDQPLADERSAIVNLDDDALAVAEVRDLDPSRKRQRRVGGGHRVHIVPFAARQPRARLFPIGAVIPRPASSPADAHGRRSQTRKNRIAAASQAPSSQRTPPIPSHSDSFRGSAPLRRSLRPTRR